jgi:predicted Zn-dependent peptidase
MFQGSANVAKGEHMQLIERAGGNMNGSTNTDRTNYFETLPPNRLNLGLWLEADRMRSLAITDANFENQRETVKEERRLRVDNQPYAPAFTEGLTLPYDSTSCFPYSHTVIGSMDDLDAAQTGDVQEFFNLYYAPNNATLTVVGDFEPADTKALIGQYFGDIPRAEAPPPVECTVAYGDLGGRSVIVDQHANLPAVLIAFLIPEHDHADTPALTLLGTIMGEGESSRLNLALVREAQSALQALSFVDSRRGPGEFIAGAIANQGIAHTTLESQLWTEIDKVVTQGVTEAELEKAKNSYRAGQVFSRQTTMGKAEALQHFAHFHDSIEDINSELARYMAVTLDDITRVAGTYLVPANSYTVIAQPADAAGAAGEEGADR